MFFITKFGGLRKITKFREIQKRKKKEFRLETPRENSSKCAVFLYESIEVISAEGEEEGGPDIQPVPQDCHLG